jgi:hypothetical protein
MELGLVGFDDAAHDVVVEFVFGEGLCVRNGCAACADVDGVFVVLVYFLDIFLRVDDTDVCEAGGLKSFLVRGCLDCPTDTAHNSSDVFGQIARQWLLQHDIANHEAASGPQHAIDFFEGFLLLWHKVQHTIADGDVVHVRGERQDFNRALMELDVRSLVLLGDHLASLHHLGAKDNSGRHARRSDPRPRQKQVHSRPTAQVEDLLAELEIRGSHRIAAPQAQTCLGRYERQIFFGVPGLHCHPSRDFDVGLGLCDLAVVIVHDILLRNCHYSVLWSSSLPASARLRTCIAAHSPASRTHGTD